LFYRSDLGRACRLSRLIHDPNPVPDGATGASGVAGIKGCDPDGQGKHHDDANVEYPRDCHLSLPRETLETYYDPERAATIKGAYYLI
jgi:hypothetical protein